jgi:tRNA(fMet)-specific endonuclease VapC
MDVLVDTSFCIDLMNEHASGAEGPAMLKLRELGGAELMVSVFTLCELAAGAEMARHAVEEMRKVEVLEEMLSVVYPDREFALRYGQTAAHLRRNGTPIPLMDLLIGVTALRSDVPLLTDDSAHFSRIPGLAIITYNM